MACEFACVAYMSGPLIYESKTRCSEFDEPSIFSIFSRAEFAVIKHHYKWKTYKNSHLKKDIKTLEPEESSSDPHENSAFFHLASGTLPLDQQGRGTEIDLSPPRRDRGKIGEKDSLGYRRF